MIGMRFGRLVVTGIGSGREAKAGKGKVRLRKTVLVQCDCGNCKEVVVGALQSGQTVSCGCYRHEVNQAVTRKNARTTCFNHSHELHSVWWSMHVRCYNTSNKRFARYGGRGITVCDRWKSFENFLQDMGERPSVKHSIDRINNDGNYCPENCRWATNKEQGNNTSKTRLVCYEGELLSITQLAEKHGILVGTLWARLKRGMELEQAIKTPLRKSTKDFDQTSAGHADPQANHSITTRRG
jgi:hypothetical protein